MAGMVLFVGASRLSFLSEGFTLSASSAQDRAEIWSERASNVSLLGNGPGSAGVAVSRTIIDTPTTRTDPLRLGIVDNQYLTWLYQYGVILGGALCLTWLSLLLTPLIVRSADPLIDALALLVGIFSVVAAISANFWEEFPPNLILAIVMGVYGAAVNSGGLVPHRFLRTITVSPDHRPLSADK